MAPTKDTKWSEEDEKLNLRWKIDHEVKSWQNLKYLYLANILNFHFRCKMQTKPNPKFEGKKKLFYHRFLQVQSTTKFENESYQFKYRYIISILSKYFLSCVRCKWKKSTALFFLHLFFFVSKNGKRNKSDSESLFYLQFHL